MRNLNKKCLWVACSIGISFGIMLSCMQGIEGNVMDGTVWVNPRYELVFDKGMLHANSRKTQCPFFFDRGLDSLNLSGSYAYSISSGKLNIQGAYLFYAFMPIGNDLMMSVMPFGGKEINHSLSQVFILVQKHGTGVVTAEIIKNIMSPRIILPNSEFVLGGYVPERLLYGYKQIDDFGYFYYSDNNGLPGQEIAVYQNDQHKLWVAKHYHNLLKVEISLEDGIYREHAKKWIVGMGLLEDERETLVLKIQNQKLDDVVDELVGNRYRVLSYYHYDDMKWHLSIHDKDADLFHAYHYMYTLTKAKQCF